MRISKCVLVQCRAAGFPTSRGYCSPFHAAIGSHIEFLQAENDNLSDRLRASHARETALNRQIFDTSNQIIAICRGNLS